MDGDNPAAMRLHRGAMDAPAAYLLAVIDKDTVDFQDNYDGKQQEPHCSFRAICRTCWSMARAASPSAWHTNIPPTTWAR